MSSIERIKDLASKEDPDAIKAWVEEHHSKVIIATDFYTGDIPSTLVERYCDDNGIPCFHICTGHVALATTYTNLMSHEETR